MLEYVEDLNNLIYYFANKFKKIPTINENVYYEIINNIDKICVDGGIDGVVSLINEYKSKYNEQSNDYPSFWNESVQQLITFFIKNLYRENLNLENNKILLNNITIADLRTANAGFNFDDTIPWTDLVNPWLNSDGKNFYDIIQPKINDSYDWTIAGNDNYKEITTTLESPEWLRLIIPRNTRRVEILDLNRNFWVIGQSISAISNFLFNENNVIKNLFNSLLNEIVELWEEIFYLWLAYVLLNHNRITPIVKEVLYDTKNYWMEQKTFDDNYNYFNNYNYWRKYPHSHQFIIPIQQTGNYKHNYHNGYSIPYIYHKTVKDEEYKQTSLTIRNFINESLSVPIKENLKNPFSFNVSINKNNAFSYSTCISESNNPAGITYRFAWGGRQTEQGLECVFPLYAINQMMVEKPKRYYSALRLINQSLHTEMYVE